MSSGTEEVFEGDKHDDYKGYRGPALDALKRFKVRVWSDVVIDSSRGTFKGIILPRTETADDKHIVLKLHSGYNVGVAAGSVNDIKEVGYRKGHYKIPEQDFPRDPGKPHVTMFGTGGTIASRLDYRTGAVIPAFTPGELYGAVPELADICNLKTEKLFGVFSENMGPYQWKVLAEAIGKEIEGGVTGIEIGHGTDTMHYSASIISYMVQNPPVPIIFVGSQRSSDRPSSDAPRNLINSTYAAANCDLAEVMVCMFGPTSDLYSLLHRGTRVRKMHSSYRSTFRTIGDLPLATARPGEIKYLNPKAKKRRQDRNVDVDTSYEEKVSIVYYYPNMMPDIIDSLVDNNYKGIVIAGTGLGHINKPLYPSIVRAVEAGVHIYMTVETLWGFVQMYVYDTGRDLMKMGIIPGANMLPEAAYMKLCWALGHTENRDEVREIMLTPIAGEITEREPYNGYIILQGGLPEVDKFLSKFYL